MLRPGDHAKPGNAAGIEPSINADVPCEALSRLLDRAVKFQPSPDILMLGELCGENVNFLGGRGFRVTVQTDIRHGLHGPFAGALLWDGLWRMPPTQARQRTELLHELLLPGAAVVALFGSPNSTEPPGRTRYRILSEGLFRPERLIGKASPVHPYQNRDIMKIFSRFELDKLLTRRDGQREALFFKARGDDPMP